MTEAELLTKWRAAIAVTDAAMREWLEDKKHAHFHPSHHHDLFMTLQKLQVAELEAARAYLAARDRAAAQVACSDTGSGARTCGHCGEADATVDLTGDGFLMWCQECVDREGK